MSQPTGAPAGGEGGAPAAAPPAQTPPAQPPAGAQSTAQNGAQPDSLADHDDGLFEVKDGDPAWVKRLRTQAGGYRTQLREAQQRIGTLENQLRERDQRDQERAQSELATRRETVAKKHGLWDERANDGKGGLLPGIDLGTGSAEEMERVATAIVSKFRSPSAGGSTRRPVTVTGTASGTPDLPKPGAGKAAEALREMMRARGTSTE